MSPSTASNGNASQKDRTRLLPLNGVAPWPHEVEGEAALVNTVKLRVVSDGKARYSERETLAS
ncbi:MAG TPA: hypothetical protein VFZ43_02595 [Anaerolineales bacterium]